MHNWTILRAAVYFGIDAIFSLNPLCSHLGNRMGLEEVVIVFSADRFLFF